MSTKDTEVSPRRTEGFQVRNANPEDLEGVLRVERSAATAPHWQAAEYERILRRVGPVKHCLLVADADRVIGFAVGSTQGERGELESVAVESGWQRHGVGAALCRAVFVWCRSEGAKEVELEVRAGSDAARRMYGRLGFIEVGRRMRYYDAPPEDAVLMRLEGYRSA